VGENGSFARWGWADFSLLYPRLTPCAAFFRRFAALFGADWPAL